MTAVRKDCGEKSLPSQVTLGRPSSPVQISSCLIDNAKAADNVSVAAKAMRRDDGCGRSISRRFISLLERQSMAEW